MGNRKTKQRRRIGMMGQLFSIRNIRSAGISAALFLFAFSASGQVAEQVDQLSLAVKSGTVEEKRDALYQLRIIGSEEAARAAIPALSDPVPIVRATAAGSLAALSSQQTTKLLIPLLKDQDDFVRLEAVLAMGETGDASAESALVRALAEDDEPEVRSAAAVALGKAGTYRSVAALTNILMEKPRKKRQRIRASSARAIGLIAIKDQPGGASTTPDSFLPLKHKTGISKTKDLTAEEDDFLDDDLAFRVASFTLSRVLADLREAQETKREAAFALGAIGDQRAIPMLERCTQSDDPYLAESCREALARLR